jgi:hypothetical protein
MRRCLACDAPWGDHGALDKEACDRKLRPNEASPGDSYARREVAPGVYQCGCRWERTEHGDTMRECVMHAQATQASVSKFEREHPEASVDLPRHRTDKARNELTALREEHEKLRNAYQALVSATLDGTENIAVLIKVRRAATKLREARETTRQWTADEVALDAALDDATKRIGPDRRTEKKL